jgi:cytochrome c oxidase cbb3-type subunit 3
MKDEKDLELDHEYDGIKELDNPLPMWWLMTFYGTVIFSAIYYVYYELMDGPGITKVYSMDEEKHRKLQEKYFEHLAEFNPDTYASNASVPEMVEFGKGIYEQNCRGCHNYNGAGDIGPNLSDEYWLYAEQGQPQNIYEFILEGNPGGGMPSWRDKLTEDKLYAVVAYVESIYGYQHKIKAKAPQGEQQPKGELDPDQSEQTE